MSLQSRITLLYIRFGVYPSFSHLWYTPEKLYTNKIDVLKRPSKALTTSYGRFYCKCRFGPCNKLTSKLYGPPCAAFEKTPGLRWSCSLLISYAYLVLRKLTYL